MSTKIELSIKEMRETEPKRREEGQSITGKMLPDAIVNTLKASCKSLELLKESSEHSLDLRETEGWYEKLYAVGNRLVNVARSGFRGLPQKNKEVEVEKPLFSVERDGDLFVISLEEVFPHKEVFDRSTGTWKYLYNKDEYFSWCRKSVINYFENNEPYLFKEKCLAYIVFYYKTEADSTDHDNLDFKYFIDGALRPFMSGDGPFDLSLWFDARIGKYEATEVYFGKESDVLKKIIELKMQE